MARNSMKPKYFSSKSKTVRTEKIHITNITVVGMATTNHLGSDNLAILNPTATFFIHEYFLWMKSNRLEEQEDLQKHIIVSLVWIVWQNQALPSSTFHSPFPSPGTRQICQLMFYLLCHMSGPLRFNQISSRIGPGRAKHSC